MMLPCLEKPEQRSNLKNFLDSWSASEQEFLRNVVSGGRHPGGISYLPHSVFDRRFCAVSHHPTCPGRHTTSPHRPSLPSLASFSDPARPLVNLLALLSWHFSEVQLSPELQTQRGSHAGRQSSHLVPERIITCL